jgi:hypothetical protein
MGVPPVLADTPMAASNPYPSVGSSGVTIFVNLHWSGDNQTVAYDVYFGTDSAPPLVLANSTATSYNPGKLQENTTYYWEIVSYNANQEFNASPVWMFMTAPDSPPSQPNIIANPPTAQRETALNFTAIALDPEGDLLYYQWNWGDGNVSDWTGPYVFGASVQSSHTYMVNGSYAITVHAKDVNGQESTWSDAKTIVIQDQFRFFNLKRGFVYLVFWGIDLGYGYSYALDKSLWTVYISNDVFTVIVNVTKNVSYMMYKMTNLVYQDEHYTIIDDNITNLTSMQYFPIDTGFYNITAYAYDNHGNQIGRTMRNWIIYINWKWPILRRIFGLK